MCTCLHTHTHICVCVCVCLCVCMYVFLHMCMTLYGTAVPSAPSINCKGVCMCFHISIYSSINTYIDFKCNWRPLYRVLSEAGIRMCVCMYVCMYVSLQSLSAFNQPCKCMCKCIHVSISWCLSINTYINSKCHWRPLYKVLGEACIRMCVHVRVHYSNNFKPTNHSKQTIPLPSSILPLCWLSALPCRLSIDRFGFVPRNVFKLSQNTRFSLLAARLRTSPGWHH